MMDIYILLFNSRFTQDKMASNDASDYNAEESVQTGMCFLSFDCLIMVIYFA